MIDHLSHFNDRAPKPRPPIARLGWRLALGLLMSLGVLTLALLNRAWIVEALGLMREARPLWLLAALGIILGSYLISSQIFQVVLRSLGYRIGVVRLWATALVAIVASQSMPAGGVGSYAFLLGAFKRRGVSSGQTALIATLEALSYAGAMLLFASFGLAYLAVHALATGPSGLPLLAPLMAGLLALLLLGGAVMALTRREATIARWLMLVNELIARALRRPRSDAWVHQVVAELMRGRALVADRRGMVALLVLIQMIALTGHSLALFVILLSLGVQISFMTVVAAFGIALLTSTVNILPGGGGTVEAALVAVLAQFGAGTAAIPAAILFRLLNFWTMLPLAVGCYAWIMRGRPLAKKGDRAA
jgi:uncharacterized protein (TIRG00374 family)